MIGAKQSWMSETCDKESCEVEAADPPISSSSFATILLRIKHHQLTILLCINIIQPPLSSSQLRGRLKLQHLHLPFYEPTALLDWHFQQQWHFEYHQIISTFLCLCWLFCRIGETPELPPSSSEGKLGTPEKNKVCRCDDVNLQDTLCYDCDDDGANLHDKEDRDGTASDYRREESGAPPRYGSANLMIMIMVNLVMMMVVMLMMMVVVVTR